MKSSPTGCMKKLEKVMPADLRGALHSRAGELRREGVDNHAAFVQAAQEQLAEVDAELKPLSQAQFKKPAEAKIEDLGEKIGGARKDTATSTGARGKKAGEDDGRPTWAKRFEISQVVRAGGQINAVRDEGRWVIRDSRSLDWMKQPRQVGRDTFATKEEAEAFLPMAAVALKHRVVPVSVKRVVKTEAEVDAQLKADMDAKAADDAKPGKIEHMLMQTASARLAAGSMTRADFEKIEAKYGAAAAKYTPAPVKLREESGSGYEIWRDISDRKRVKVVDKLFDSRDEAMAYMAQHAVQILETNTTFGEADLPQPPDRARTGPQRRTGEVKGDDFRNTFGFRGVEFGNWNNQEERQTLMNDAYDGLLDLADVLGVPPKALGLNGDLALAFGARGQGLNSARAHYELERAVINLTKENGAGSLAHEWFHALDHYFGRQDGKATSEWIQKDDGTRTLKARGPEDSASHGFSHKSQVRPEVRAAYEALIQTMFKKATQYVEDTVKADNFTARAKDDLARELDAIRKELGAQKDPAYWKRNNKPASAEQLAEFDAIAKRMVDGEAQALATDWRSVESAKKIAHRWTNDTLEQVGALYKAVRGRSGFDSTNRNGTMDRLQGYMKRYSERLKQLADAQQGAEKTRMVPTDFAMNAKELDQGRGTDYWTTPHEMAARAFQGYVEDKIAESGGVSRFLNYAPENAGILTPWGAKRPYPAGEERKAINAALDKFMGTLQTEQTGTGVRLFKRGEEPMPSGLTMDDARAQIRAMRGARASDVQKIVDETTAGWKDGPKVTVVQTAADLPGDNPPDVRGLYQRGHIWVVAGAHRSGPTLRRSLARTLAHEAVAHYGLRNMLGREGWTQLMNNIQLGVKSGNRELRRIRDYVRETYVDDTGALALSAAQEADEIAAKAVEEAIDADGNFKPGFGFLKSAWAKVAQFLRDLGISVQFTNAELQGMLVLSMRNLEAGQRTAGGGQLALAAAREDGPMHHRAYHGTPHDFERFTTEKIGSGEGNQSFGWGLYFAENEGVAESYKKALSGRVRLDGEAPNHMKLNSMQTFMVDMFTNRKDAGLDDARAREQTAAWAKKHFQIKELGEDKINEFVARLDTMQGNIFEVHIPDEVVGRMLLWDKPLSDQPANVLDALARAPELARLIPSTTSSDSSNPFSAVELAPMTGAELYERLTKDEGSKQTASAVLERHGIPGIRFLDGQSRNRPLKDIKREFLAELPEDADFNEVMDLVGTGTFSPANEAILKALKADDWLGFDYPSQALSAALGGQLANYDASPALVQAVADAQVDATHNLVVFNEKNVEVTHKNGEPVTKQERDDFLEGAHARAAPAGDQTDTPEFKRWFGSSKVVDGRGRPLVVYHGTVEDVEGGFDLKKTGLRTGNKYGDGAVFFTSNPAAASAYAAAPFRDLHPNDKPNVVPAYLSLQNPLEIEADDRSWVHVADRVREAQKQGHDGAIVRNVLDHASAVTAVQEGPVDVFVAFKGEQIKSAIGNRGTFDQFDGDIRHARGTTADQQDEPAAPVRPQISPWRDGTGRLQFAPGAWLYDKLGAAAGPLLSKLQFKAASPELRRALRDMKLQVQNAQETAAAVAREAMKLSEAERTMVSDLIEHELAAGTIPPEHAVRLAAMINASMGAQTDELVRLGMLTRESADMWRDKYLPRFYRSKLALPTGNAWADALRRVAGMPKSLVGIKGKHLKGRGLYQTVAETELPHWEAMGWQVRDPDFQPGLTGDGTVQVWRDFTPAERESMGEIRDAGFRFVMGYMQTQRDIALGRMFEQLAGDPDLSSRRETEAFSVQVPDGTVPGTGAKRYGKLAGRWVSTDTMSHLTQIEEAQSSAWRLYRQAMAVWKMGKTSLNPVSHVNNMLSNLTMAHFGGVSYWRGDRYLAAAHDFATKADRIKEAKEAGLFLGTLSEAELYATLPEDLKALVRKQEGLTTKVARTGFDVMTFFLRRPMGWAYQAEDTFFRYLLYSDARNRGMEPADAVDHAQRFIFTYDDLPKGARIVRDFGIPFFSYTYKAAPVLLHTALAHPLRFAAPAALLWAANAAAYAIAAGDDDDDWREKLRKYLTDPAYRQKAREMEQLEREHLPPWMKGTTALLTPKTIRLGMDEVTKLPLFIDISRLIPGGDLFDVSPNAGGIPLPQPITPSHPLFTTAVAMLANKDLFFGKDLVDMNDTRGEAAAKRTDWLWKQLSPAIAIGNYHFERGMNALAQASGGEVKWLPQEISDHYTGVGKDGTPVQTKYAVANTFGIKVRPIDLELAEKIDQNLRNKMIRDIDAEVHKLQRLNAKGAVSDNVMEKERAKALEKKQRLREGLTVDGDAKD